MPPTGKLRWHQPVPFVLSDNDCMRSIDASHFGHKCMQLETDGQTISGTENCLFMNVWTHSGLVNSGTQRNVFVYIHSGGLMTGSGNEPGMV
jgi:carboxylesterase type B